MLKNVGKIADPFIPDNLFPIPADFEALDLGEYWKCLVRINF